MNEITTFNAADLADLAKELGAKSSASNGQRIPVLRINRALEDDKGRELPRGQMFLSGDTPVYATEVTFRPLSHHFQYSKYDSATKKYTCWTRQIADWGEEPRDTKGTLRCGKPDGKTLNAMDRDARAKYKDVKLVRLVRGLVTYTGKTIDGEEVTIENQPCILKLSGQNNFQSGEGKPYAPFEEQFKKRIPKGYEMWNFEVTLTTKKHKNETGDVIWYTFEYGFDPTLPLPVTQNIYDSVVAVAQIVREENAKVDKAYMAALKGDIDNLDDYEVLGEDLDNDLEDVA
jgi:hypothetical protein